ncbi:NADP-dependent malic enzyme [Candidatus Pacearchaeota archaeon]|nr:NADP-dependent malic enzyme [Candidatus Pacearchaeota archaeon]
MGIREEALKLHKEKKGKLEIKLKMDIKNKKDLSLAYTPGVAQVCREIAEDKNKVFDYTIKNNTVAVVTDGSAVLGLGNIGPEASLPVMEGKCALFKEFANIDAFPICLDTQDAKEIIDIVKKISPGFGGINLEDISAPRCFEVEEALQDIGIPVFHDDQHGTAIVVLAALINAARVVGKKIENLKIVISGSGAAGIAVSKMLLCFNIDKKICIPVKNIILMDSKGAVYHCRENLNKTKKLMATITNAECTGKEYDSENEKCRNCQRGELEKALEGADVFIGVSKGGLMRKEMIKKMNPKPIIFALANPIPEIMPDEAKVEGAAVIGTGRSDYPNQINNVLVFPGIFKGALEANARVINNEMKIAAANALASCVDNPTAEKIIADPFDKEVVKRVSEAVKNAAIETGAVKSR